MSKKRQPGTFVLHDYQNTVVTDICRRSQDVLVEQPTGSGKTVEIVALIARLLGTAYSHAVIAAPQEQIEASFVHRSYQRIVADKGQVLAAGSEKIRAAREANSSLRNLREYFEMPDPGFALACTHAALAFLQPHQLPADLTRFLLTIDEAHHGPAAGLSAIVREFKQRGARILYFTATPFRKDGLPVQLPGMHLIRRSLAEHMQDGDGRFAPRYLESEIVAVAARHKRVAAGVFAGKSALPPDIQKELIGEIVRKWEHDGRPKTIVRVPPVAGGCNELVKGLIEGFRQQRARVLDATGSGPHHKARFLDALGRERNDALAVSHDVLVGIQRVLEGTDWPPCAAVYCVGMPTSLQVVVQLIGRAMRPKGPDYPAAHRDRARIVFFVPTAGGRALQRLPVEHSRSALLVSCFLADSTTGQEWLFAQAVRRGITRKLGKPSTSPKAADVLAQAETPVAPEARSLVQVAAAMAYHKAKAKGQQLSFAELQEAVENDPLTQEVDQFDRAHVLGELLTQVEPQRVAQAVAAQVAAQIPASGNHSPGLSRRELMKVFETVLNEFRSCTITSCPALEVVCQQVHRLTGSYMQQVAQRLREATSVRISIEEVRKEIEAYHEREGRFPTVSSGACDRFGCTWGVLNQSLRLGHRGLPAGSSLANEVQAVRTRNGQVQPVRTDLTLEEVHADFAAFYRKHGTFPSRDSGRCETLPLTYHQLNTYLYRGKRGLPGRSSVAQETQVAAEKLGIEVIDTHSPLTIAQVHGAIRRYRKDHGQFPTRASGYIPALRTTWKALDHALHGGNRGLAKSSLTREIVVVARQLGQKVRKLCKPAFSLSQVHGAIVAYRRRTGRFPTVNSGHSLELDADWRSVNMALSQGLRGLPGESSLSREVARVKECSNKASGC